MQHKFRAWDKHNKKFWYFDFEEIFREGCECSLHAIQDSKHLALYSQWSLRDMPKNQFTGLHDKNGEGIYGDDILNTGENNIYFVEYWLDRFSLCKKTENGFYRIALSVYGKTSLVIGNIYQHPELLQSKQVET